MRGSGHSATEHFGCYLPYLVIPGKLLHSAARWQRSLRNYGRNATLVLSQNVHELRAYNMAARMRKADIVVFLQDDEEPPASEGCEWLGRGLAAFGLNKQLGAVGLRRGATNGDWDDEVRRHGRPSLGQPDESRMSFLMCSPFRPRTRL